MKDFLGRELKVGDWVMSTHYKYKRLITGKISKFTENFVTIEVVSEFGNSYFENRRPNNVYLIKD